MSRTCSAERTQRPVLFCCTHIGLSLLAMFILTACNPAASGDTFVRNSIPRTVNANGDVIDLLACTKGLRGDLRTARAGYTLLADNGLTVEEGPSELPTPEASDYIEPIPSASASLQVKANATGALLMTAYGQTGRHYKRGGQTPAAGFDAPGFTRWVYSQRGISIPKDARRQASGGRQIAKEDVRPGDLLVYRDPAERNSFHVGIYTGKGNFLHAAAKNGVVTETDAFGPQFSPYFVGARRYYDDPKAAPLSDNQKMTAASSAVKTALLELGPDDQPDRKTYSKPKKRPAKAKARRTNKRRR